jgi:tetratricopeptide (TPR) repeat protein
MLRKIVSLLSVMTAVSLGAAQDESSISNHLNQANNHAKSGEYAKALEEVNQVLATDPDNARAYKIRGHVYHAMGDHLQALTDLNKVTALVPASANAYVDRAIVQSHLGNHGAALVDVERALNLKPDSQFAQIVRARILENAHVN